MADLLPIARSPIPPAAPLGSIGGWEVSRGQTSAALRLLDLTPCAKLLLRGFATPALSTLLPQFGHARRLPAAPLVVAAIPNEWLLIGAPGAASVIRHRVISALDGLPAAFIDLTHALVMLRIAGAQSAGVLSKLCAINFGGAAFPHGCALRSSVAKVPCAIVRDDLPAPPGDAHAAGGASPGSAALAYLLICDRPVGQYIFDAILDAGSEYKIGIGGFAFD